MQQVPRREGLTAGAYRMDAPARGELLMDFAVKSTDSAGYPTMVASPGEIPSIPARETVLARMEA